MISSNILGSGSAGNGTIINNKILIDAGLPYCLIWPYIYNLQIVLLTHRHSDHFKPSTVRRLQIVRPGLRFACCDWMVPLLVQSGIRKENIDVATPKEPLVYRDFVIEPFLLHHNVPNCGWKVFFRDTEEKLFYATDTGNLDDVVALDYDLYLIECNHHEDEIEARIAAKTALGEFCYETEAAKNHLSWEKAISWLQENGPESTFIPMHQHREKEE